MTTVTTIAPPPASSTTRMAILPTVLHVTRIIWATVLLSQRWAR